MESTYGNGIGVEIKHETKLEARPSELAHACIFEYSVPGAAQTTSLVRRPCDVRRIHIHDLALGLSVDALHPCEAALEAFVPRSIGLGLQESREREHEVHETTIGADEILGEVWVNFRNVFAHVSANRGPKLDGLQPCIQIHLPSRSLVLLNS